MRTGSQHKSGVNGIQAGQQRQPDTKNASPISTSASLHESLLHKSVAHGVDEVGISGCPCRKRASAMRSARDDTSSEKARASVYLRRGWTKVHLCYCGIRLGRRASRGRTGWQPSPDNCRHANDISSAKAAQSSRVELGHTSILCGCFKMRSSQSFSAERMCARRPSASPGTRISGTHGGKTFAIRPVIVGKHPKKIFSVHGAPLYKTCCEARQRVAAGFATTIR